jgi:hypothetical protein
MSDRFMVARAGSDPRWMTTAIPKTILIVIVIPILSIVLIYAATRPDTFHVGRATSSSSR